jgi:uncharacterized integral membrane protein (TIGR00697 family)
MIKKSEETTMKKTTTLQVILTVVFVSAMLISNIITTKQLQFPFGITMTGAIVIFPITYILSDVFSECYGYRWSRITCYLAFAMNLLMVGVFTLTINLPAPSYWENQEAYQTVLGSAPRVLVSSLFAYVIGDFANDKIFQKMKQKHKHDSEGFSLRAILSSIAGNFVDSFIFLPLAFFGQMPVKTLAVMCISQVGLKTLYETIMLPMTNLTVKMVNKYERS